MEYIDFKNLQEFSNFIQEISDKIGFKLSARGWAYILEQKRYINKDQFDKVNNTINKCRKEGYLPIDFTAEESSRQFKGVERPQTNGIIDDFGLWLKSSKEAAEKYTPNWWDGEEYYIQMVVEKVDLVTLFQPICEKYHIPIANSRGWSSMLQRAIYARRFAVQEAKGRKCVLLYCGDHDPDGLRISEFMRKNLKDLQDIKWSWGASGYDPKNLIIDRFGLNYDFIIKNKFTWIDNLITASKKNLADPYHKNYNMPYVQQYLRDIGERKCEANAIVTLPEIAQKLVEDTIKSYLGKDALDRFEKKRQEIRDELNEFLEDSGTDELMEDIFNNIDNYS